MNSLYTKLNLFFLSLLVSITLNAQIAVVDGYIGEWDLTNDFYADMHRAGDNSKPVETKLYLRWICDVEGIPSDLYVLVLQADPTIPVITSPADEAFVKIDGVKMVDGNSDDFEWYDKGYDSDQDHARGWEASFPLGEGTYSISVVHTNVYDDGEPQTSSVEFELVLDCDDPLPVELSSFSATINNNLAQLIWETATEVNNYGFEIQRTSKKNNWEKIGFVEGHGNSNSPKYYSFTDNSINESGNYSYRLKQIDIDGRFEYSDVVNVDLSVPVNYNLNQNYPNPFNPTTSISYSIPKDAHVEILIYDMLGNEIAVLENGYKSAGVYNKTFDASRLSSGFYFYTIRAGEFTSTKKMLLMK